MHHFWRCILVFGALQLGAAASPVCPAATGELFIPTGNPQRGRDVFVEKGCLACHAVRGIGGRNGPDLAEAVTQKGVLAIGAGMWSHVPQMSKALREKGEAFPTLSPREVKDLLAYLLFIGFVTEPGDPSKGRILFSKRGCVTCHAFGGVGGPNGPALHDIGGAISSTAIAQEMWNHSLRAVGPTDGGEIEWSTLHEGEMADLIAFLAGPSNASSLPADLPGSPASGKHAFELKGCAHCHFPGPDGQPVGPDLSKVAWYKTSTQMAAVMWNHRPEVAAMARNAGIEMPYMQGTDMADIVAYLYVLRSAEQVGDASRGKSVYTAKKCAECHEREGVGVDLRTSAALQSPAHLGSAMWNHAPTMQEAVESRGLEWPALSGQDIADLLAYLLGSKVTIEPGGS